MLVLTNVAGTQTYRSSAVTTIDAGTTVIVRTNESIDTSESDGRVYFGLVEQDVMDRNSHVVIPKGSDVELIVRTTSNGELALDLDSVMVNGQRYAVESEENVLGPERKEGIGANKRTAKYVGGGAILGAIVGAIAGGGKGAAIGASAGVAAGAGAQVLTRGGSVKVPAESLLTFQLTEPLRAGIPDGGYLRYDVHYHPDYSDPNEQSVTNIGREKPDYYSSVPASITIGADKYIRWDGPESTTVYSQVDNNPPQLFASGKSGMQPAAWIKRGHLYVFTLKDAGGNEIARDRQDLRHPRYKR
jgi:hypothetical protein